MGRISNKRRQSRASLKIANARKKRKAYWNKALTIFKASKLKHQQGKMKSVAEKKLIISSLMLLLSKEMDALKLRGGNITRK